MSERFICLPPQQVLRFHGVDPERAWEIALNQTLERVLSGMYNAVWDEDENILHFELTEEVEQWSNRVGHRVDPAPAKDHGHTYTLTLRVVPECGTIKHAL